MESSTLVPRLIAEAGALANQHHHHACPEDFADFVSHRDATLVHQHNGTNLPRHRREQVQKRAHKRCGMEPAGRRRQPVCDDERKIEWGVAARSQRDSAFRCQPSSEVGPPKVDGAVRCGRLALHRFNAQGPKLGSKRIGFENLVDSVAGKGQGLLQL